MPERACDCGDCPACRACEAYRARLKAEALRSDKRARLYETEVRGGAQARKLLSEIKDSWYDEIVVTVAHEYEE